MSGSSFCIIIYPICACHRWRDLEMNHWGSEGGTKGWWTEFSLSLSLSLFCIHIYIYILSIYINTVKRYSEQAKEIPAYGVPFFMYGSCYIFLIISMSWQIRSCVAEKNQGASTVGLWTLGCGSLLGLQFCVKGVAEAFHKHGGQRIAAKTATRC